MPVSEKPFFFMALNCGISLILCPLIKEITAVFNIDNLKSLLKSHILDDSFLLHLFICF